MHRLHAARPTAPASEFPIETARAIAVIALVSFHVIGGRQGGGLDVDYPHPLRFYADLMVDIRMPIFAFIAGLVYALKPVAPQDLRAFMIGKMRRLALPGITAITVFVLFAMVMNTRDVPQGPLWEPYLRSYAIFWFLQAMLLIFVFYGSADILSGGRVLLPTLVVAALAVALGWRFPTDVMSADRVTTLLVYFLLGVAFMRHRDLMLDRRGIFLAFAGLALAAGLAMNLAHLSATGALSADRLDLQSLLFGAGLCVVALLALPVLGWLRWLGAFSLTIYLYHILATSAARRALGALGVDSLWLLAIAGTAIGVLLPVILHLLAQRTALTRLMVLGLRPNWPARRMQAGSAAQAK
jgi:peptidoglycan/LPS O-acetylase OafA/YrhL